MTDYNPTTYLVRVLFKDDGAGITMDTTSNKVLQQTVAGMVQAVGNTFLRIYEMAEPKGDVYYEVLTGATMNQIGRREDLLNAARNLLIEVGPTNKKQFDKIVESMIDEIGEEIGVAQ